MSSTTAVHEDVRTPRTLQERLADFRPETYHDFSDPETAERMREALREVESDLGRAYPNRIGGRDVTLGETLSSLDPAEPDRVIRIFPKGDAALADRELARLESMVGRADVLVIRSLVSKTQQFTRLRERMRAKVTRTLGLIRLVALDIDRRLRRLDPGLEKESVFFCTYEELVGALRTGRAEVAHIIRLRRAEYLRDAARPDWGVGQVQSAIGSRVTVNFEHCGKQSLDMRHVRLELEGALEVGAPGRQGPLTARLRHQGHDAMRIAT